MDAILKSKQLGFSTLLLLYSYFLATTYRNVLCGHISRDSGQNAEFLEVIRYIHSAAVEAGGWRKPALGKESGQMEFPSLGSRIRFMAPRRGAGRGLPWAFIHVSELPWWGDMGDDRRKEVIVGLMESMRPFGALVIESTPYMIGDVFGRICRGTDPDLAHAFHVHRYDWRYKWTMEEAVERRRRLGDRLFAREHACDFGRAGDTVYRVVPEFAQDADPIGTFEGDDRKFWIGVDIASGAGEDRTVIRVIDPETGRGHHRCGRWTYLDAAYILRDHVLPMYPGKVLGERAGGYFDAFAGACREVGVRLARGPDGRKGFPMNARTKPETVRILDQGFRDGAYWLSRCLAEDQPEDRELERTEIEEVVELPNGTTGHLPGRHDDHEAAFRMAVMCGRQRRTRVERVEIDQSTPSTTRAIQAHDREVRSRRPFARLRRGD